jgi:hypothetical protein
VDQDTYNQMVSHRNLGLAYLEEERYSDAANEFKMLVETAPNEPLGYANLGLTYMRMSGQLEQSEEWLQKALKLVPNDPDIRLLLAKVYELTNRKLQAVAALENTLKTHPDHLRSLYQLALYYSKIQDPSSKKKAAENMAQVVGILPGNIAATLRLIELLLQGENPGEALQQLEIFQQTLPRLPDGSHDLFRRILELLKKGETENAYTPVIMLHNLMKPTSIYQGSLKELRGTSGPVSGAPVYRFLGTIIPDRYKTGQIPGTLIYRNVTESSGFNVISNEKSISQKGEYIPLIMALGDYDSDGDQDLFVSKWSDIENTCYQYLFNNDQGIFLDHAVKAGINHTSRDLSAIFADYDNDGHLDLFITNTQENRLYKNLGEGIFKPVINTGINTKDNSTAAVFVDLDLEGDLDLFLATDSRNRLYRNNSDGTFIERGEDSGISDSSVPSKNVVYADFDNDGDVDLFVLNQDGDNQYYDNLRQSYFRNITNNRGLVTSSTPGAVAVGDYNNDGSVDLFITDRFGKEHRLYNNLGDGTFESNSKWHDSEKGIRKINGYDTEFFDADNDGYLDLLIAGSTDDQQGQESGLRLLYNNGSGSFINASSLIPDILGSIDQIDVADYDNDGDVDIFLATSQGQIKLLRNDGGNINNFLNIRLAGLRTGSSKNNYFGIGAKVEVRAGDLYQVRYMDQPTAHFGLGNRNGADVLRVVWSNGVPQNRFKLEQNQTIVETQSLKGSCPYLFGWTDSGYEFITDVLWPSALGMPLGIMAGEPLYAFPNSTDEYLRVPGNSLAIKDGSYFLQFTTELWETPYLDKIELLVVDHPESVNVFIDETFIPPPYPPFRIYNFTDKQLPIAAVDGKGTEVLDKIIHPDEEYISNLVLDLYQGVTELHDLILVFDDLSSADSLFLFLQGWLFPTDASINVNISQSSLFRSIFPYLQVPDAQGNWITVKDNLGFPKGKNKTMVIDLTDKFLSDDYRVRIRTNMQIYWDHIFIASTLPKNTFRTADLKPVAANLHYRGFSQISRRNFSSPHIPDYYSITTGQKWRDLTGTYTRYGDVLSLLLDSDNKYVIMNAGDEITLQFDASALPQLQAGWSRDFMFYNDGWLKDGDLNTAQGQTVEPLPFHGMTSYPAGAENAYPLDEDHATYRKQYNTRIVTTEPFKQFLSEPNK